MAILPQLARIPKIIPFAHLWSEEISDLLYLRLHSGGVQHCREENTDIYVFRISDLIKKFITQNAEATIALFKALGFERRHMTTGINDKDITSVRMRYTGEDGKVFHVDIASASVPQDITTIRMNVRDFDEAYRMLEEKGFKNAQGEDHAIESKYARSCLMVAPSGFTIQLTQHIRNHD